MTDLPAKSAAAPAPRRGHSAVPRSFAAFSLVISASFLVGTYFVDSDMGKSFFLGAFSTGLAGAVALLVYTKLARLGERLRATVEGVEAPSAGTDTAPTASGTARRHGLLRLGERATESVILNALAFIALLLAVGFLGGTYILDNDLGQSYCLGAFSTGLAGAIVLLAHTKVARISESLRLERAVRASETRFRSWIEHASDMITVLGPDGVIQFEAPSVHKVLGYEPDHLIGKVIFDFVHPEDRPALQAAFANCVADPDRVVTTQYRVCHRDNSWRVLEASATCVVAGDRREVVSNARNVTERKQMEDALCQSQERFKDFAETAADFFWETDDELRFSYLSGRFQEKTRLPVEAVLGKRRQDVFSADVHNAANWERHFEDLEARRPYTDFEIKQLYPDGAVRVLRDSGKPIFDADGVFQGYRGAARDVTDAHFLSEKLSYQATHDMLTGLTNRRHFEERLQRVIETARRDGSDHVLCFLDLDQFKVVNDTCGHVAGDGLLRQLGALLKERTRQRDTVARLGGDEFAVLMEHCTLEHGERVSNDILQAVEDFRYSWDQTEFNVGVSIGLVLITESCESVTEVLNAADSACYMAKDRGRNRVHVSSGEDTELAQRHGEAQWVTRIYRALEEDRFRLSFQRIVELAANTDATTPRNDHFEVLLRLEDESGQVVLPGVFLPAAERYGLISRIDQWVIRAALGWLSRSPKKLEALSLCSINLSGHSLADETFPDFIVREFDASKVPPGKICFEITETSAISNVNRATRFMNTLRSMGCKFALDDFGSGFSSFAYLRSLPVDFVKIDGFFVKNVATSPVDLAMVRSINEVGQVMGKKTIAEYADNAEVIKTLRAIGVDYVQGYGVHEPEPVEKLGERAGNRGLPP